MRIGLPKEIKNHEYRVGLSDALYQSAGATLAADAAAGMRHAATGR